MKYWYLVLGLLIIAAVSTVWAEDDDSADEEDSSEHGNRKIPGEKTTTCDCGWANKEDQRIVGGEETKVNEYPMMAGIYYKPKKLLFCGGAVITEKHILTAAHCTEPFEDDGVENLQIVLGEHDQDKVDESSNAIYMDVSQFTQHPEYYLVGHKHDISIIETVGKIAKSLTIGPACMPTESNIKIGDKVKVLGWGKLKADGPSSKVLMKANLFVKPKQFCLETYADNMVDFNQICTFHPGKDSCQGDSGGPLIKIDPETNRYVLVGLVSFASGCATENPAVNTNVTQYMDWIRETVSKTSGANLCTKQN